MNTTIQNILVFATVALAAVFLVRKYIWKPKKSSTKHCGSGGCDCD